MSQHSDDDQGGVGAAAATAGPPPAANRGAAMITTSGIITVASILVVFVLLALCISSLQYCLHYLDSRSRGEGRRRRRRGTGTTTARRRGVDPDLLRSLPVTMYYRAAAAATDGAVEECAVCLAELQDGEEARFLPRCGHGFHAGCVDAWLASHTTCPLCRLTVAKPDPDPDTPPPPASACSLSALHPVPHELPNYGGSNLPASVLLGASDHHQGATTAALVIEIPEPAAPTPRDAAKSPGSTSARLRTIRRLWSFGRQGGAGSSSTCAGGSSERADVEQGIISVTEAQLPSEAAASA